MKPSPLLDDVLATGTEAGDCWAFISELCEQKGTLLFLNSTVWGIYASWYMSLWIHRFFSIIVLIFHFTKLHLFAVSHLKDSGHI